MRNSPCPLYHCDSCNDDAVEAFFPVFALNHRGKFEEYPTIRGRRGIFLCRWFFVSRSAIFTERVASRIKLAKETRYRFRAFISPPPLLPRHKAFFSTTSSLTIPPFASSLDSSRSSFNEPCAYLSSNLFVSFLRSAYRRVDEHRRQPPHTASLPTTGLSPLS